MHESFFNPQVVLFIVLAGAAALTAAFIFRKQRWSFFVWFPVPATALLYAFVYGARTLELLPKFNRPGTLEGLELIFALPGFLLWVIVLVFSYLLRPPKEMFRATLIGPAILIYAFVCIGAEIGIYSGRTDEWILFVKDASDVPVPNALVDFHSVAKGRTVATKRADSEGRISVRIMGEFTASIHNEHNQDNATGQVGPTGAYDGRPGLVLQYQWITRIADQRVTNRVRQEMPLGSPRSITLYITPSRSVPMNPVLRRLDKQFAESPMDAIRASEVHGRGNFIALRHLDVIKTAFDKGIVTHPQIFASVAGFLIFLEDPIKHLTWHFQNKTWSKQDSEDLHTLHVFLGQDESDNLGTAEKLESLKKRRDDLNRELRRLMRSPSTRSTKTRSQSD